LFKLAVEKDTLDLSKAYNTMCSPGESKETHAAHSGGLEEDSDVDDYGSADFYGDEDYEGDDDEEDNGESAD
jgi:hypothetical protein